MISIASADPDARRDSLVLQPDSTAPITIPVSDVGMQLLPLQRFESVRACGIAVIADRAANIELTNFSPHR